MSAGALQHLSGKRILVTGGTGFIGGHLLNRLMKADAEIHAVSRDPQAESTRALTWWKVDLSETDETGRLVKTVKPDFIFHLAGQVEGARSIDLVIPSFRNSVSSTVNLLTAAARADCRKIIFTGSMEEPDAESGMDDIVSPYAAAKSACSTYTRMFYRLFGAPVVNLRLFMVYGPNQKDEKKIIPYVIKSLLNGQTPKLSSGRREIDWIYVDDVVSALIAASASAGTEGETIDIGSGATTSIRAVVEKIAAIMNRGIAPVFGALPDRPFEAVRKADITKARSTLNWNPAVSLNHGLGLTIEWYTRN